MGQSILNALELVLDPTVLIVCVLSGLLGIVIGSLPGLSATLGAALLIPFTFFLDPVPAIASIITMSAMAIFTGDIPGALLRMPGTPSSAAYVTELYGYTKKGRSSLGLTIALFCSVVGGLVGSVVLIFIAPWVGEFALGFTSYEYFWVAVLGLTAAVIVSQGSLIKGGIALMVGLLISTVGMDVSLGFPRFTFGQSELLQGVDFIPAMIGLFGLSEVIRSMTARRSTNSTRVHAATNHTGSVRGALGTMWRHKGALAQGNATGAVTGALPGAGADIAAWISYAIAKNGANARKAMGKVKSKLSKSPKRIDEVDGVDVDAGPMVAATGANNAALGSAFIPTLAFGIPGDTITAILIGVLLVKGVEPGPNLFLINTDTLYAIYIVFIIANLLLIPLGLLAIRTSGLILRLPRPVLMAAIIALSMTGAYAINHGYLEVLIVLALGIIGFLFERYRIPLAPVVLGIVLGPIVEQNFMQSVIKTNWDLGQFFTRPVSAVLIVLTLLMLFYPLIAKGVRAIAGRRSAVTDEATEAESEHELPGVK